ncbi:MAG: LPS export ABC transporter ATP-binding protein [Planctomycetes bacterium]|nr:LPS export ABC transporter ATP-binding protein [Planctomycetota bacterium]MBL7007762.1 LPS export ABC transporter ATP-binding protein [Planctomycetota bacterium]
MLETEGLVKSYRGRRVVDEVALGIQDGEIVGLLGPNGAGKTTTFRMCMGMVTPDAGRIHFRGREVTRLPIHRRARLGLGYLAQEPSVFRKLSVEDNLLAILELIGLAARLRRDRCDALMEEFGLSHVRKSLGEVLSGGERRRLEIARTLATEPSLILLDEPFSGVDPIAVEEIQEILARLKQKRIAILLTDHNVRETLHITDRAYILAEGRVLAEGTPAALVDDPKVREVYLGKRFALG